MAPGLDVVHAVAHDELGAVLELLDEAGDVGEVVGQVGVGHDDVLAAGGAEAGQVGGAVAAARLVHDAGAGLGGELGGAVARAVVGDDDLAVEVVLCSASRARVTHSTIVSASLRHGITTETRGGRAGSSAGTATGACNLSVVLMRDARGPRKSRGIGGEG
jgi:hypothetical protein